MTTNNCLVMELDPEFTFVHLEHVNLPNISNKQTQQYLEKWGLKDNLSFQQFCFNEPFQSYNKYHLVESFFKSEIVAKSLKIQKNYNWTIGGVKAKKVDATFIPCKVTNMMFFEKFKNPENNIVWSSGTIQNTYYNEIDGFTISNNLQDALLNEESDHYNLYNSNEKEEFIFKIFQLLVLGGSLCQFEDELQPYLDVTKKFYKDLVRVQKQETGELSINSIVFQVIAKELDEKCYFPRNPDHRQNVAFLCISPHARLITTLLHQFN